MDEKIKVSAGTIARTIILALALINQILYASGHAVIPIENEDIETLVNTGFTIVVAIITYWKNNSWTNAALQGDMVMNSVRKAEKEQTK